MVEQGDLPREERGGVCDPQACLWTEEGSLSVVYVGLVFRHVLTMHLAQWMCVMM